jgi:hypothetical protein
MALTDDNMNATMLVQPAGGINYGGNMGGGFGFGGDWAWILLLLVLGGGWGGFGGFGMGGFGGAMMGADMGGFGLYPWLNNSQNINDGFRDAQLHDSVTSVRDGISSLSTQLCNCCGDMQLGLANGVNSINQNLCNGFNGVNNSIFGAQTAISQQLNSNELASLNRSFAEQTANAQGFNGVQAQLAQNGFAQQAGTADLKYTIATENCADRYEAAQNTRDIVDAVRGGNQMIMDKLCALELDGVKNQLAQAQRENVGLQNQLNMANFNASQTAQNAFIAEGLNREVDALYNRLKNCPVNTVPVYGNQPIFTCPQSANTCGCNGGF